MRAPVLPTGLIATDSALQGSLVDGELIPADRRTDGNTRQARPARAVVAEPDRGPNR